MTELAGLVARRLCHDFAGPVGAISTALDMLDNDDRGEILALVRESARGLAAALRLYRAILSPSETGMHNNEARTMLADWLATRNNVVLDWQVSDELIAPDSVSTMLGLAFVASEALARGGTLTIGADFIEAEGPSLRLDEDVRESLAGSSDSVAPRAALVRLVMSNADVAGHSVEVTSNTPKLHLRIVKKSGSPG